MGEQGAPQLLIRLAQDLPGFLHRHLPHQRQGERLEFLRQPPAATFPRRAHGVNLPAVRSGRTVLLYDIRRFDCRLKSSAWCSTSHEGNQNTRVLPPHVRLPLRDVFFTVHCEKISALMK
jgi:hypothetical protein